MSQLFKVFQGRWKLLEDSKIFFKDEGYNQF